MNNSVEQKFKDLERSDQKIAFDALMEDQGINYKLVMNEACRDANDRSAAEKVIDNVINTASKRHKNNGSDANSFQTPPKVVRSNNTTPQYSSPESVHSTGSVAAEKERFLRRPIIGTDTTKAHATRGSSATKTAKTKTMVNTRNGIYPISIIETYEKLGWPKDCNVICDIKPNRDTNPIRCLKTLAKLMNIDVDPVDIETIPFISDLENFSLPFILDWLENTGIILVNSELEFDELFSCGAKSKDLILLITANEVHQTHEGHLENNPPQNTYIMFSIIIPDEPHIMLLFNSTNTNLWLGKNILKRDWGTKKDSATRNSCKHYMSENLYQKMDPIKKKYTKELAGNSVKRKLKVLFQYTIKNSAKTYRHVASNQQQS